METNSSIEAGTKTRAAFFWRSVICAALSIASGTIVSALSPPHDHQSRLDDPIFKKFAKTRKINDNTGEPELDITLTGDDCVTFDRDILVCASAKQTRYHLLDIQKNNMAKDWDPNRYNASPIYSVESTDLQWEEAFTIDPNLFWYRSGTRSTTDMDDLIRGLMRHKDWNMVATNADVESNVVVYNVGPILQGLRGNQWDIITMSASTEEAEVEVTGKINVTWEFDYVNRSHQEKKRKKSLTLHR